MRSRSFLLMTVSFAFLMFSCGSSMESDAKKFAELQCETMQDALKGEVGAIDTAREEAMDELEGKYRESNEIAKFRQLVDKEYKENCKLNTR